MARFELTYFVQVGDRLCPLVIGQAVGVEVKVITEVGVEEEEALPGETASLPLIDGACLRQRFFTEASFWRRTSSRCEMAGRK